MKNRLKYWYNVLKFKRSWGVNWKGAKYFADLHMRGTYGNI